MTWKMAFWMYESNMFNGLLYDLEMGKPWIKVCCWKRRGKPKCKARLNTGEKRGMGSSIDGNHRLSGGR